MGKGTKIHMYARKKPIVYVLFWQNCDTLHRARPGHRFLELICSCYFVCFPFSLSIFVVSKSGLSRERGDGRFPWLSGEIDQRSWSADLPYSCEEGDRRGEEL